MKCIDPQVAIDRQRGHHDALIEVVPVGQSHHLLEVWLERLEKGAVEHVLVVQA